MAGVPRERVVRGAAAVSAQGLEDPHSAAHPGLEKPPMLPRDGHGESPSVGYTGADQAVGARQKKEYIRQLRKAAKQLATRLSAYEEFRGSKTKIRQVVKNYLKDGRPGDIENDVTLTRAILAVQEERVDSDLIRAMPIDKAVYTHWGEILSGLKNQLDSLEKLDEAKLRKFWLTIIVTVDALNITTGVDSVEKYLYIHLPTDMAEEKKNFTRFLREGPPEKTDGAQAQTSAAKPAAEATLKPDGYKPSPPDPNDPSIV